MFSRRKQDSIDLAHIRFCGGSEMIVGDENVFYVCCALIAGIQAIEQLPQRKRSIFQNHMLYEWKRLLAYQADWMQKVEDFNK